MGKEKVQTRIEQAPQAEGAARSAVAETGSPAPAVAHATPDARHGVEAPADTGHAPAEKGQATGAASADASAWARFSAWFSSTFPHSGHAVVGGLCGLLVAVMLFTIGLLKTLVIAVLVTVGVAIGQFADGDPKLVNLLRDLIKRS